ncbi:FadR family transcriptional regulator [Lentzea tibetensis]|uniref:FadR family transcriptional regulator n=1 Tax=Lentzea tibetensis TaxID=2591470 RepID=A0A563EY35_9PSEU|nr:FadR/GntR family transcriptional regulator [Lentzea tibetensis]TWP52647.1 FadR family transcriptional regulator [Lentzea tibetensis]
MNDENSPDAGNWALPLDSRRPLPELIEEQLRAKIADGSLEAGDRLPTEPELARQLNVARSSLRTALQSLQHRGIVEVRRGLGWYVRTTNLDEDEFVDRQFTGNHFSDADLLETRIALETAATSLAATRATDGELDEIAKLSTMYQRATELADTIEADEAFHLAIVRASHNRLLEKLYLALVPQLRAYRRSTATRPVHNRSANDHQQVVMWLRRRDEVGARIAMTTHLLGLYQDFAEAAEREATMTNFVSVDDEPMWTSAD